MLRGRVQSPQLPAGMVGGEGDWQRRGTSVWRSAPALGRAGKEILPSGGKQQSDRRKRPGWDESSPSRGATEGARQTRDRLLARGPPGSLMVRTWSQSGNEIYRKKKLAGIRRLKGRIDDSKIGTLGALGGDGLTKEMCIFKNLC